MTISLKEQYGGIILFDFKAAFPSLDHDYLFRCLEYLGVPSSALNVLRALYDQVRCALQFRGSSYEDFLMTAGVRQGCPLSPLLFAVTVDLLLRRLERLFPDVMLRAFADDIGAVIRDLPRDADLLMRTFDDFGKLSGLELNRPKTIVIPLWEEGLVEAKNKMVEANADWSWAKYSFRGLFGCCGGARQPGLFMGPCL